MFQSLYWPAAESRAIRGSAALADPVELKRYRFLQRFQHASHASWEEQSIYRVLPRMRDLNAEAYKPRLVSIGPYHHGKEHLEAMEVHKQRALSHFLLRASNRGFDDVIERFRDEKVLRSLRASYSAALDPEWDDDYAFVCLMVLDGCFLLELLLTNCGVQLCQDPVTDGCYAPDDPVFGVGASRHGILAYVRVDLLLIENQLPLRVLWNLAQFAELSLDFNWLVRELYGLNPAGVPPEPNSALGLHFLDVYRSSRLSSGDYAGWIAPLGALELNHHGVHIHRGRNDRAPFKSITFSKKNRMSFLHSVYDHFMEPVLHHQQRLGIPRFLLRVFRFLPVPPAGFCRVPFARWTAEWYISSAVLWILHLLLTTFFLLTLWWYMPLWVLKAELTLPRMEVDESTEAVLLNMMAFEVLHLGRSTSDMGVTCYVLLMGSLMRREEDVRFLRKKGVVRCVPERGDAEVVRMVERVGKGVVVGEGRGVVNVEMEKVCTRRPNRWSAAWRRYCWNDVDSFKTRATTLLAAYGLVFTIASLVIAVLSYALQANRPMLCAMKKDG